MLYVSKDLSIRNVEYAETDPLPQYTPKYNPSIEMLVHPYKEFDRDKIHTQCTEVYGQPFPRFELCAQVLNVDPQNPSACSSIQWIVLFVVEH